MSVCVYVCMCVYNVLCDQKNVSLGPIGYRYKCTHPFEEVYTHILLEIVSNSLRKWKVFNHIFPMEINNINV